MPTGEGLSWCGLPHPVQPGFQPCQERATSMPCLKHNSIPLALCVFTALAVATQFASGQSLSEQASDRSSERLYELELQVLRAQQLEAMERHTREMEALERAAETLRLRNFDAATRSARPMDERTSSTIPEGALGVVHINRPREMTLLQLRGMAGSGSALVRLEGRCLSIPLRFVAGDFGGQTIAARRAPPIRIAIRSQDVLAALLEGEDIVSDLYRVSHVMGDPTADLVLLEGLSEDHGFIINPGRSLIDDFFGVQGLYVPCIG